MSTDYTKHTQLKKKKNKTKRVCDNNFLLVVSFVKKYLSRGETGEPSSAKIFVILTMAA